MEALWLLARPSDGPCPTSCCVMMSCVHFVCAHVCACRGRKGSSVSPSIKETRYLTEHGASGLQLQQASPSHPPVSAAFRAGVRGLCTAMPVEPSLVYQGPWWPRAHLVPEADLELLSPEMTACAFTPGCHSPLSLFIPLVIPRASRHRHYCDHRLWPKLLWTS